MGPGRRQCLSLGTALYLLVCLTNTARAAAPVFSNEPYVQTLYELENAQTTLATLSCTDSDNDATVVSLPSGAVTPATPCGNCFSVLPCNSGDYCLDFVPVGTLNHTLAPTYDVTVSCTDGTNTVTAVVDVRLTVNTPPRFDPNVFVVNAPPVSGAFNKNAGYVVYDKLKAVDNDNDPITFTMTSEPASDNFDIGPGDGTIRAKNDLDRECNDFITFKVCISDSINQPVGPLSLHVSLNGANQAPQITNLDTSIQKPEDTAVGTTIHTLTVTDDKNINLVTYTMTADPSANLALFELDGLDVKVKAGLNFEVSPSLLSTNLTIVANDGMCTSQPHYLYVTITDANDPPDLQPEDRVYSVYEGSDLDSQLTIAWNVLDEDQVDTRTYSIIEGDPIFSIDPSSGQISVNADYDIDNNAMPTSQTIKVQVKDKGDLTDTTTVTFYFKDRNDHYPEITTGNYAYSRCYETAIIGEVLGTLVCTDGDSAFQGNNDVYFTGSGDWITVRADGGLVLGNRPSLGQVLTATAYCWDRGQWPTPLRSQSPTFISVTGLQCSTGTPVPVVTTTSAPTTTTITTTTTTTTPAPVTTTESPRSWWEDNLPWIVVAGLLAVTLLGLMVYMLLTYCRRFCHACCRRPVKVTRRPLTPPTKITPVEKQRPTTPPANIVGSPGRLFNFWQERYPNDDYVRQPNRDSTPRPVTPDILAISEYGGPIDGLGGPRDGLGGPRDGLGGPRDGLGVPAAKRSRCCNIL